jgi:hypothetical protein
MVERDVPGDPEQPPRQLALGGHRDGDPADPEEHLLRQVPGELGFAGRTAQIPAQPVVVEGEELVGVGHGRLGQLLSGTTPRPDPLTLPCGTPSRRRAVKAQNVWKDFLS